MGVAFTVVYHDAVVKEDIPKLSTAASRRIQSAIETKLMTQPEVFGVPLRRSLKGYRELRVADYRVIFRIVDRTVYVLTIQHRSVVYTTADKRI